VIFAGLAESGGVPELPDILVYQRALERRVVGRVLERVSVRSPSLLRTFEPALEEAEGRAAVGVSRLGKRIVLELACGAAEDPDLFLVIHLMIAGRFLWKAAGVAPKVKIDLAAFGFENGTLLLTEAGTTRRAQLHLLASRDALRELGRGGIDPLTCTLDQFIEALTRESRTLKRALTSPHLFSGIGNAYSDEILHAAKLSPVQLTRNLGPEEISTLHRTTRQTLERWTATLLKEFKLDQEGEGRFPGVGDITAFRPDFAVHGRYREPCPVCGTPIQRIVRAENEVNYCPTCQTGGKLLADRSLSRLLKEDWPESVEAWEDMVGGKAAGRPPAGPRGKGRGKPGGGGSGAGAR
jgi:formamidopyrimidine-DNA glycosylase